MKIKTILAVTSLFIPLWLIEPAKAQVCSVSGQLYGTYNRSFSVVLFNANNGEAIAKFSASPSYRIGINRRGRYLLRVFRDESGSLFAVRTDPSQRLIDCRNNIQFTNADFFL